MAAIDDLRRAYSRTRVYTRQSLVNRIVALWRGLGSWDRTDIDRFAPPAARLVRAGQLQEARLTLGYLDRVSRLRTGRPSPTVPIERIPGRQNRKPLQDVYTRPFVWTWTEMVEDDELDQAEAADRVVQRIERSVETDLQLVSRNTADAVIRADERIIGYRRVLSEKPNHCDLCIIASTNTYRRGDLLPIHPACSCTVEPIYGARRDIEAEIDRKLDEAYARAAERTTAVVLDHGEYGPYLQAA